MSEIGDVIRDIEHILLSRGAHHGLIFSDVGNIKGQGKYSSGDCPFCGKAGKFRISNERAISSCWSGSCSWGGEWHNWLAYAEERGRASGWQPFYRELARAAGIEWPEPDAESQARYQAQKQRQGLLESAAQLMGEALTRPEGAAALAYWQSRGYSAEDIQQMGLLAYPGIERMLKGLLALGHAEDAIRAADLLNHNWIEHPAIMLWRDRAGQPAGLMGRAIEPGIEPKYLYSRGMAKSQMLPGIERARQHDELILVESPLAAAFLSSRGLSRPVVAIGGSSLSKAQIQALQQARARRLILALDADAAGQDGAEKAIKGLLEAEGIERLLIASWQPPSEGQSGLDDYALAHGIAAAERAIETAERVGGWMARRLAVGLPAEPEALEEEAMLERAVEQYLWLARRDAIQARDYVEALADELGWDADLIWPRMDKAEKRLREKESRELAEALIGEAQAALVKGDRDAAADALDRARAAARGGQLISLPSPYRWEQGLLDITQAPDALSTGWGKLDERISIHRGALSIISAGSGVGKTTVMLNLLSQWVDTYTDQAFYFWSYEEQPSAIMLKLIMMRAGVILSQEQNYLAYVNYLKGARARGEAAPGYKGPGKWADAYDSIERAIEWYQLAAESGRLIIDYSMPTGERLAEQLDLLGKRGRVGAAIVDYIQRVPSESKAQSRQLELAATTQRLRQTAVTHGLAIVTGSQITDDGQVRESRDIYHEAALVLGLTQAEQTADMSVSIEKYRHGKAGKPDILLAFDKPCYRLKTSNTTSSSVWGASKAKEK